MLEREFDKVIRERTADGYKVRHLRVFKRLNNAGNAVFEDFVQADSPDDHHFRLPLKNFPDLEAAISNVCCGLRDYIDSRKPNPDKNPERAE